MKTQVLEIHSLYLFFLPLGMDGVDVYQQFAPYLTVSYHSPFESALSILDQTADLAVFDYVQNYYRQAQNPWWIKLCECLASHKTVVVVMAGLELRQRQAASEYFARCGRHVKVWDLNYWDYYAHLSKGVKASPVLMQLTLIQYILQNSNSLAEGSASALLLVNRHKQLKQWQCYLANHSFKCQVETASLSLWLGNPNCIPQYIFILTEQGYTPKRLNTLPASWLAQAQIYYPAATHQKPSFKHLHNLWLKIKIAVQATFVTFYIPILK